MEERHQDIVQTRLANVSQKISSLEFELETRKQNLQAIDLSTNGEDDSVARSGAECLNSARTALDMSTPDSEGGDMEETHSSGSSHPILEPADGFTANGLTRLINRCLHEAQICRRLKQYDEAVICQSEAISYARQREHEYGIIFRDEPTIMMTLADLNLERHTYTDVTDILENLLNKEKNTSQRATIKHKLGQAYLAHGNYQFAARHANEANSWKQANLKDGHESIIETLNLLTRIYDMMGRLNVSNEFASEALRHQLLIPGNFDEEIEKAFQQGLTTQEVLDILNKANNTDEDRGILALKAFHLAVASNQEETMKRLWDSYPTVRLGKDVPNKIGMTPLISATSWGHEAIVKFLLETGEANVNARYSGNSSEDTALLIAANKQFVSIVELLLNHEANPQDSNKYGRNAIHRAMGPPVGEDDAKRSAIVRLLLRKNREALLAAKCAADKHALHMAAEVGNKTMIELLISEGAEIEAKDCAGRTPLFCAIDSGKVTAVETLIKHEAELNEKDNLGRTVWRAANWPVGNAHKIRRILKEETRAKSRKNSVRLRQLVDGSRLSLSLWPLPTQSSTRSILNPPNETLSIFRPNSTDNHNSEKTVYVKTSNTTTARSEIYLGSKVRRVFCMPGHRVRQGSNQAKEEKDARN